MGDDLKLLHWLDIRKRIGFKIALLAHKAVMGTAPTYLQEFLRYAHHGHPLKLIVPNVASSSGPRAFSFAGPKIYNNLPDSVKMCYSDENIFI